MAARSTTAAEKLGPRRRRPPHRRRTVGLAAAVAGALLATAGCGELGATGGGLVSYNDTGGGWDGGAVTDVPSDAAAASDAGPGEDTPADIGGADAAADVRPDGGGKTDGPAPPAGPSRSSVTLDGDRAAWVEVSPSGQRSLVVWTLTQPDLPPTPYPWPYLVQPRGLVLTQGWLLFEDTPYNDPDVFALRLADGAVQSVVTRPGAQRSPAAAPPQVGEGGGGALRVAWEDCRDCVAGDEARPEIYLRGLDQDAAEQRLTADDVADRAPVGGTLVDGAPGLAWLSGDAHAKVWSAPAGEGGAMQTVALPFSGAAGVALTRGMLVSRPSPLIINPDSMVPSDVFLTDLATLQTRRLSTHAELAAQTPAAPVAQGGRVAWMEAVAGAPAGSWEAVLVDVDDPSVELLRAPFQGATGIAVSAGWLGATVPGADGRTDAWFHATP